MPRTKGPVFSVTGYLVWNYFAQCYEIILDDDQTQTVVFRNNGLLMRWRIKQWRKYRVTMTGHSCGDLEMLVMKVRRVKKPDWRGEQDEVIWGCCTIHRNCKK